MDIVSSSSLAPELKALLKASGLTGAAALRHVKLSALSKLLRCSTSDAAGYKREIDAAFGWSEARGVGTHALSGQSVLDMISESSRGFRHIVTFCKHLDLVLGGGVQLKEVTEFCGAPGVGKTQLCMQLALDVQIPPAISGLGGAAVYIDTEGSLVPARLAGMAEALSSFVSALVKKKRLTEADPGLEAWLATRFTPAALLSNIHVYRCTTLQEQHACLSSLHTFLEAHPEVRLIVLDSVAFHFRYSGTGAGGGEDEAGDAPPPPAGSASAAAGIAADMGARARLLHTTAQTLHRLAAAYNCAVVVTNQMTVRGGGERDREGSSSSSGGGGDFGVAADGTLLSTSGSPFSGSSSNAGGARLVPALGETWAHACTNRVVLGWCPPGVPLPLPRGGGAASSAPSTASSSTAPEIFVSPVPVRVARLVKSPRAAPDAAPYLVTAEGVRTVKSSSGPAGATMGGSGERLAGVKRSAEAAGLA